MILLRVLASRIRAMFTRRRSDLELNDEIQTHLDLLVEEHVRQGLSLADARAAARQAFGGVEQVKEIYGERRGFPFVQAIAQDVRFGARLLVKDHWFTVAAAMTLALGIACALEVGVFFLRVLRVFVVRPSKLTFVSLWFEGRGTASVLWCQISAC